MQYLPQKNRKSVTFNDTQVAKKIICVSWITLHIHRHIHHCQHREYII